MPTIFGPDNPRFLQARNEDNTGWVRITGKPVLTKAKTLGEAIFAYEQAFAVSVIPYDGSFSEVPFASGEEPKYFILHKNGDSGTTLVDIHILRDGTTICPKQQLDFLLEPTDILELGALIC